jgi:hypothetical protein
MTIKLLLIKTISEVHVIPSRPSTSLGAGCDGEGSGREILRRLADGSFPQDDVG